MLIIKYIIEIICQIPTHPVMSYTLWTNITYTQYHIKLIIILKKTDTAAVLCYTLMKSIHNWIHKFQPQVRESDGTLVVALSLWNGQAGVCTCVWVWWLCFFSVGEEFRGVGPLTLGLQSQHHSNSHSGQDPVYLGQTLPLPLHDLLYLNLRIYSMSVLR